MCPENEKRIRCIWNNKGHLLPIAERLKRNVLALAVRKPQWARFNPSVRDQKDNQDIVLIVYNRSVSLSTDGDNTRPPVIKWQPIMYDVFIEKPWM